MSTDAESPDTVQMAHRCYRDSRDHTADWREEARESYDMAAGTQWSSTDLQLLEDQKRPAVTFNRIARTLNAIVGTQVSNRQETRYIPRELGDQQVNEILTAAADWARDQCEAEDEESDSFEDMCTTGMGWTETRLDYDHDPEGKLVIERVDPLEMYWDPGATKRNLSDARWVMRVKKMDQTEFMERWPDAGVDYSSDPWEGKDDEPNQREHVYPQDAYKWEQATKSGRKNAKKVRVGHIQWSTREEVYRVGGTAEAVTAKAFKKLKKKLDAQGIQYVKQHQVRWKQAFIACGEVLEEDNCPFPEGPTLRCMTYKRDRNKNLWYGIVRAMLDPQRFGNKFFSQILDILNKGAKGGVIMERDAVDDTKEVENKWARPDGIVFVKSGAIAQGKIQPKPIVQLPAGLDRLMQFSMDGVHEVTGINLELLGMANREQAGVLEHQRKQAGVTIIAPLFDGLRRYRKEQGRVMLYFIQHYLSDGRLIRISGNGTERFVPLIRDSGTAQYDVIVDEAPTSPNMKERVFGIMSELLPTLAKMGVPIPPELLDYSPLPSSLIAKWKEQIQQAGGDPRQMQEQMQQMQQQMQQMQQENVQLKDKKQETVANLQLEAQKAQADIALEREKAAADIQLEREKFLAEMELERVKMEAQFSLDRDKAGAEMTLKQDGMTADAASKQIDQAIKTAKDLAFVFDGKKFNLKRGDQGEVLSANVQQQPSGKKHITVERGADGEITGATVEETTQ